MAVKLPLVPINSQNVFRYTNTYASISLDISLIYILVLLLSLKQRKFFYISGVLGEKTSSKNALFLRYNHLKVRLCHLIFIFRSGTKQVYHCFLDLEKDFIVLQCVFQYYANRAIHDVIFVRSLRECIQEYLIDLLKRSACFFLFQTFFV